jgi:type IV secretory pathway component VirB8
MDRWHTEQLSPEAEEAFFAATRDRQAATERAMKQHNSLGYWVGTSGLVAGLLVLGSALIVYHKVPPKAEVDYILVDSSRGVVLPRVSAKDAPMLYPESVRQGALVEFIKACESYIPQTWAKIDYHACMIRATHDEQKRREAEIGSGGTRYPPKVFGPTGWAMPDDFPALGGFLLLGSTGTPPNQVFHYTVRYGRAEIINNTIAHAHYTADVVFMFRPDLKMAADDIALNPTYLQVASFSTVKDR